MSPGNSTLGSSCFRNLGKMVSSGDLAFGRQFASEPQDQDSSLRIRMNAITRNITIDLLRVFLVTLTGLTSVIMLVFVIQDMIRESLTPLTALQLIPYAVPGALIFAIPGTMLFAVCTVYGRMAADNEITAIKSLGISPWLVMRPAVIVAMAMSFVTVYLSDVAVPWGRSGMYRVVLHSVHHTIYGALRAKRTYNKGPISIRVEDVADESLVHPVIETQGKVSLIAESAQLQCDTLRNQLLLVAHNGKITLGEDSLNFPNFRYEFQLDELVKKSDVSTSPSNIPMSRLPDAIAEQQELNQRMKLDMETAVVLAALGGRMGPQIRSQWDQKNAELEYGQVRVKKLELEGARRWAGGFSCLCFAFVGAAVSIRYRFADFWSIFIFCFIPILVVYYPILAYTSDQVKAGDLPSISVWASNVVVFIVGLAILRSILKN